MKQYCGIWSAQLKSTNSAICLGIFQRSIIKHTYAYNEVNTLALKTIHILLYPIVDYLLYSVRKLKFTFGTSTFCDVVHVGSTLFIPLSIYQVQEHTDYHIHKIFILCINIKLGLTIILCGLVCRYNCRVKDCKSYFRLD